ncbi:DUF6502 family protein [Inhella gelatinilytica]|uniref:Uncharacterized protein n=1 Tax=Inhella gelatinilytica TaxID=2795030 RepID=A0A931IS24_9BURK|nr:DUF6502 family protein [Inhella gelatinilytica]MBH9551635.1 hypothetical protein [Inhella gelatinilytica]
MHPTAREQSLYIATLLLRPLIRILVRKGVELGELTELSKRVYVEQAVQLLEQEGRRVTDAAVSTLTGVHRKDVKRIGSEAPLFQSERRRKSLLDATLSLWSGDVRFIDGRGAPRPLERRSQVREAQLPTFEDLIEEVSKGVPPRALLEAWLQQGAVVLDDAGRVCWAQHERVEGEDMQVMARSARLSADRLHAAWDNLLGRNPAHALYYVRAEGLLAEDVAPLNALVARWGRRFAQRVNRLVTLAQTRGREAGGDQRFSFGIQSYAVAVDAPDAALSEAAAPSDPAA